MSIPNVITVSRIYLTFVFAAFAQGSGLGAYLWAAIIFTVAAFSDWADGYLARKWNMTSTFGKLMDPIADKGLTLTAFFIFAFQGLFPLALVMLVAAREILITTSRIHMMTRGQVIPAEKAGKVKTVMQMTTISLALLFRLLAVWPLSAELMKNYEFVWRGGLNFLMIIVAILTVWSGAVYWRNLNQNSPGKDKS
jgi:CDP-diacylglycerol--glycerol-3-phosphate 3-phosphatidyltransferase